MTATLLGVHEPNTDPWYKLRAGGIGGSEIASVVNLSPYTSAFWLWHFKKGNIGGQYVSDAMDWGHRLEPVVRQWFADLHPEFGVEATPGTYAHPDRPWQRCNPDGLVLDGDYEHTLGLYEGKTARYPDAWGKSGTGDIPLHYRCQIQWSLDIFGLSRAYLAVLIGGNEPRQYVIDADPEDQAVLREAGERFWNSIQSDDEPPIDASDSTHEAVRNLHPDIDREATVDLGPDLAESWAITKDELDRATAEHQQIKSQILAAMGTARIAKFNNQPVLRRQMSSTGTPYLKEIA